MKITILDNRELYEFDLNKLIQLCGTNVIKKEFIVSSIEKYFSNYKYYEYESAMINNVLINDERVGRDYLNVKIIRSREDLIKAFKISKGNILKKHIDKILLDYECQKHLFIIEQELETIYAELNDNFLGGKGRIKLSYDANNIIEIVSESNVVFEDNDIEEMSNLLLLKEYVKLIRINQAEEGKKTLLIIDNIDHFVSVEEYKAIMKDIINIGLESDLCALVSTSLPGYVCVERDLINGIVVINDITYQLSDYDKLEDFIVSNYPVEKDITENKIMDMITDIAHEIGKEKADGFESMILLRLLNESECLYVHKCSDISVPEICFLIRRNVL